MRKPNLLQFLDDHREGFKNGGGGSCEGYDPLWTVPLWDVDASTALQTQKCKQHRNQLASSDDAEKNSKVQLWSSLFLFGSSKVFTSSLIFFTDSPFCGETADMQYFQNTERPAADCISPTVKNILPCQLCFQPPAEMNKTKRKR